MMKENKAIPKKVKGTVLFTVVAVMMVLIVFLTATLALATTANKRAYTNYQQEQAEYTAKAVLSAVSKQIESDTTGSGIRKDVVGLAANATATIPVTADDTSETYNVIVTNTGEKHSVYDTTNLVWKDIPIYSFSVTVDSQTTAASATYESYMAIDVVTIPGTPGTPPTGSVSSGNGGAFVSLGDTAGTELSTKGYTTGGTYLGIGVTGYNYTMSSSGRNVINAPFFVNGNLAVPSEFWLHFSGPGEFMVVKGDFTATNDNSFQIAFDGYDSTGQTYEKTPYVYVDGRFTLGVGNNNGGGVDKVGDSDHPVNLFCGSANFTTSSSSESIYGDLYLMDADKESILNSSGSASRLYKWTKGTLSRVDKRNKDTEYGNIYSMGSVKVTGAGIEIDGDLQVKGDLTVAGYLKVNGNIIVEGKITNKSSLVAGGTIYAGTIENSGVISSTGAVYAVNHSGNNPQGKNFTDLTGLTPVTESSISKKYYTNSATWIVDTGGNHYKIQAAYTEYSIDDKGNVTTSVHGDPVNNNEYWNRDTLQEIDFTPDATYPTVEDYVMANNELYKNIKTATDSASAVTVTNTRTHYSLDTYCGKTKEVYPADYTRENLNRPNDGTIATPTLDQPQKIDYNTLYKTSLDNLDATIYKNSKYQVTIYSENGSYSGTHTSGLTADPVKKIDTLEDSGVYKVTENCVLNGSFNKNIYIDSHAAGKEVTVILDNVTLEGNNGTSIVIDDEKQVTLFVVGNFNVGTSGQGCSVITKDYLDMFSNKPITANLKNFPNQMTKDATVYQERSSTDPEYPNVIVYGEDGSTMHVHNNGFVTALVRAPKMIYQSEQASIASKTINYTLPNGNAVKYGKDCDISTDDTGIGLVGQLIAGKIVLPSTGNWGMLYVTDPTNNGKPGHGLGGSSSGTPGTSATTTSTASLLFTNIY